MIYFQRPNALNQDSTVFILLIRRWKSPFLNFLKFEKKQDFFVELWWFQSDCCNLSRFMTQESARQEKTPQVRKAFEQKKCESFYLIPRTFPFYEFPSKINLKFNPFNYGSNLIPYYGSNLIPLIMAQATKLIRYRVLSKNDFCHTEKYNEYFQMVHLLYM